MMSIEVFEFIYYMTENQKFSIYIEKYWISIIDRKTKKEVFKMRKNLDLATKRANDLDYMFKNKGATRDEKIRLLLDVNS